MIRIFSLLLVMAGAVNLAHADAYSLVDNEEARAARNQLYPGPVNTVSRRIQFIKALTGEPIASYSVTPGYQACGGAQVNFVTVRLRRSGRVCTSPAPTSCERRTVSCE